MMMRRGGHALAALAVLAVTLAGCSSMRSSQRSAEAAPPPEQLQPVQSSTVATSTLPPIGQVNPNLTGTPVTTGPTMQPATLPPAPGAPAQTATTDGSFVTLDSVGTVPTQLGRDLSGGLTVEKLLGGWTVISGATECRLNLTQTTKTGTGRYRASTPGCQLQGMAGVASWELSGSQVRLFDENNNTIAVMVLSGNRFIGTLAGGQGISMAG